MKLWHISLVALAILFVGAFFLFPKAQAPIVSKDTPVEVRKENSSEESIVFTDSFKKGTHTLSGVVTLPTPCYQVAEKIEVNTDASPESVTVALTTSTDDRICIQVVDEREVSISFDAVDDAIISITLDGKTVTLKK